MELDSFSPHKMIIDEAEYILLVEEVDSLRDLVEIQKEEIEKLKFIIEKA